MSTPFPASSAVDSKPLPKGVDCYGGTKDVKVGGQSKNAFDDDIYSTGGLPKGVNKYGATPDINYGTLSNLGNKDMTSTGALPQGVDKFGATNNNEQPGTKNIK